MMALESFLVFAAFASIVSYANNFFFIAPFPDAGEVHKCPPNEIYKTCYGNCSDCTQRGQCAMTTCYKGCDCLPRFYRKTPDGPCVPVEACPIPECGENEVFRECGPICERCKTLHCQILSCDHKCYCKSGYLRNEEEKCILEDECPERLRCMRNEEWADSGPVDEFCMNASNTTDALETQNRTRCYCKEGYKRSRLGTCIAEERCLRIQCVGNEQFHTCVPKCNTTCRNRGDPNCEEDDNCYPGCFCPSGYFMNDIRQCVEADKCSTEMMHELVQLPSVTSGDNTTTQQPDAVSETDAGVTPLGSESEKTSQSPGLQKPTTSDPNSNCSKLSTTEAQSTSTEISVDDDFDFDNQDL